MMRFLFLLGWTLVAGCGGEDAPPLEIDDVSIYAALPGSRASVAYFNLRNNTDETLVIHSMTSPDFGRVEVHESRLEDGIARMTAIGELSVPGRGQVTLAEGGKHVMLMDPRGGLVLDEPVTLLIAYDSGSEIVVRSNLKSRVRLDAN